MRRWLAFLLLAVTTAAFGAVPKVTITGKVIAPDGLTYAGSINCVMSAPATAMDGGTSVRVQSTGTLTIASDGTVSGALVANDITTPTTAYTCTTRLNRVPVYTQTELIYLTTGSGTVDWGAISRPGATPYTPVGVAGSSGAVQASNGLGGLADSGVTATAGALTAKSVVGIRYANQYATGGAGTTVSPWTGWETAITTLPSTGGSVVFPKGYYYTSSPVVIPYDGIQISGEVNVNRGGVNNNGSVVHASGTWSGDAVFKGTNINGVTIRDLKITGTGTTSANAILAYGGNRWTIENVFADQFTGPCIDLATDGSSNVTGRLSNIWVENCVKGSSLAAKTGAIQVEWTDTYIDSVTGSTSSSDYSESGKRVGILLAGSFNFMVNSVGHLSEDGIALTGTYNRVANCRADLNRGNGFVVTGGSNAVSNSLAMNNSQQTDNTYDGFYVATGTNSTFTGNTNGYNLTNKVRYAFNDASGSGANAWQGNYSPAASYGTGEYSNASGIGRWFGPSTASGFAGELRGSLKVGDPTSSTEYARLTFPGSAAVANFGFSKSNLSWAFDYDGTLNMAADPFVTNTSFAAQSFVLKPSAAYSGNRITITGATPTASQTATFPDATGTVVLDRDNGPGAVAALRSHLSAYGDPSFSERPAFVDMYVDFFHGQPLMTDFSGGASGYKDPVFTVAQCPANTPSSGSCTDTTGIDYVCISDPNGDGTAGDDISVGDGIVFIGTAASSALGTPTGQTYYVTAIGAGGGAGTDCPNTGNNKKVTLRPRPNYVSEGIVSGTTKLTTVWHQAYHWGYAASYLAGYQLAFASRDTYGAHGRNLISNGVLNGNTGKTPPGWTATNFTLGYQQFQTTPTVASTTQCWEGEAGTAPYACVNDATCASGGFMETGWIDVEPGARYVADGFLTAYATDAVGLYSDKNEDGTYEALTGNTTWAFDGLLFNRFWGVPQHWTRSYTIPWDVPRVKFRYVSGASCSSGNPTMDAWSLRRLTTRQADGEVAAYAGGTTYAAGTSVSYGGQVWTSTLSSNVGHQPDVSPTWWSPTGGRFLIEDPGTRNIVYTGDSWAQNDGTNFSNGKKFCDGLKAGMQARLGRDISAQIICNGRGGETTAQLLSGTACTTQLSTGGALNCWNDQIASLNPLYTIVILGTNDVIGSVASGTYVGNMKQIAKRLQSIGSVPIFLSPAPIENSFGSYAYMASAHAYYTLLKHAVFDEAP